MGHSLGEYVAACIAGVFSLEDGLKLVAERGRLMQTLPQTGNMVAVLANEKLVQTALEPDVEGVTIAAINGPKNVVISGRREGVEKAVAILAAKGIDSRILKVSHAFHSPLMEPMLADFKRVATQIAYSSPQIDLISNLTGQPATSEIATPEYWCRHILQPVRFARSMDCLTDRGYEIFIEIGAKPILLGMGSRCLTDTALQQVAFLPSLHPRSDDWQQLLASLAELYIGGISIDWSGFHRDYSRRLIQLPTYPFQRQRYWIDRSDDNISIQNQNVHSEEIEAWLQQTVKLLPQLLELLHQHQHYKASKELPSDLSLEVEPTSPPQEPWLLQSLKATPQNERLAFLIAQIQREVATVLRFSSSELPNPTLGFFDMGMDSLLAVELKNRLENSLGTSISSTVAFNHPNIESLARYVLYEVFDFEGTEKSELVRDDTNELDLTAEQVENLSEAEVEALLVQKLANL